LELKKKKVNRDAFTELRKEVRRRSGEEEGEGGTRWQREEAAVEPHEEEFD
jgi:hypothetical protein